MHFVFFHVLVASSFVAAQESTAPIRVPPKLAGNWMFSTITVAGEKGPLQIAALPATTIVVLPNGKKAAPYLVLYCQSGGTRPLRAFLDLRVSPGAEGVVRATVNGKEFPPFAMSALQEGDWSRLKLPPDLTAVLREAAAVDLEAPGQTARFLLLHWPAVRDRLEASCR